MPECVRKFEIDLDLVLANAYTMFVIIILLLLINKEAALSHLTLAWIYCAIFITSSLPLFMFRFLKKLMISVESTFPSSLEVEYWSPKKLNLLPKTALQSHNISLKFLALLRTIHSLGLRLCRVYSDCNSVYNYSFTNLDRFSLDRFPSFCFF